MLCRRRFLLSLGPWALSLTLVSCGGGNSPRFLSIATGGTGGVYYPYGGTVARLISQHIPGVQATAEVTAASVDNLKLLQLGKVDIAFTLADTLAEAVAGRGPFKESGAVGTVRTLAVLYTNYLHVVAPAGKGIRTVADLKGRVVSVGSPGSGTELLADRALATAGIDPRTGITRHTLSVAESAGALKDGKVDAFFWSGGLPTASIQDLAATPGMSIAMIGQVDLLPSLQRQFGAELYRLATIPPGTYRGIDTEIHTIGVTNLLVASSTMDEELAFQIVKMLFDQKAALEAGHPEGRHLAPPTSMSASPAEFHPGAKRYYGGGGGGQVLK